MGVQKTLNQDFFKVWSSEMAYVLGFFAADGSMTITTRGGYYVEFKNTEKILIEHVKSATRSEHAITAYERGGNCKTCYRLQIGCKEWIQDLKQLGFTPSKSRTLRFPQVPEEYIGHFVRGYFDGDGCVYFNELKYADRVSKRWILMTLFTSGSLHFLASLHSLLLSNGVRGGSIVKKHRGYELKLSHRDSLALYRFMYNTAQAPQLFLPRKKEKLELALQALGLEDQLQR